MKVFKGESEDQTPAWSKTYKDILNMKKEIDGQAKSPGARVYDLPMDQLVFDKVNSYKEIENKTDPFQKALPSSSHLPSRRLNMPPIVDSAFTLADSIRSHSSKSSKDSNFKVSLAFPFFLFNFVFGKIRIFADWND